MVVRAIACHNNKKIWISEEVLNEIGGVQEDAKKVTVSNMEITKRSVGKTRLNGSDLSSHTSDLPSI